MYKDVSIKVSILMPIFKVEQYLEKALDSVFSQTYENINFVFVNDCSPDGSLQLLKDTIEKYKISSDRYIIIDHKENEGIAVSRADCIANAKGDYVFFVDSDDWIEKDAVEQMVKSTQNASIDIVGCDYMKEFLSGQTTYHHENYSTTCYGNLVACLNYDIATVLWKLLIRRSLFDNFEIIPYVDIGEDYIISIKLFYYANSFAAVPKHFYHYVQTNPQRLSFQKKLSVDTHVKCVRIVEDFLRVQGLLNEEIQNKLKLRKFNIRSNYLTRDLFDFQAFLYTFPESNGMWREMNYSKKEDIKFWLAEHNLYSFMKFLYFTRWKKT